MAILTTALIFLALSAYLSVLRVSSDELLDGLHHINKTTLETNTPTMAMRSCPLLLTVPDGCEHDRFTVVTK